MNSFLLKRMLMVKGTLTAVIFLVAACGRSPLALPQAEQVAQPPPTQQSASTVRAIQEPISPLPTPPAAPLRNDNPTLTPGVRATDAPFAEGETSQPGPQVVVLTPVTPTLSYEEALQAGEVTIGDYTFSLPQEVPDGRGPVEIIGWLPDSPNEIVDTRTRQIVAINMDTGQIREFSKPFARTPPLPSIKLLKNDKVAFTPDLGEGQKIELWLSGADDKQATAPTIPEIRPPSILAPDEESLLIFDPDTPQVNLLETNGTIRKPPLAAQSLEQLVTQPEPSSEEQSLPLFSVTSPASGWIALYGLEDFKLFNLNSGLTREVDLGYLRAESVDWSPDGQKAALLVTEGSRPPLSFMKLFVLDINNEQVMEMETGFRYVQDVTWAPDSKNLLITAITGQGETEDYAYETSHLFLIDLSLHKMIPVNILPDNSVLGFRWGVSWAPDGQRIAIAAVYPPLGNPQLYRIDVNLATP